VHGAPPRALAGLSILETPSPNGVPRDGGGCVPSTRHTNPGVDRKGELLRGGGKRTTFRYFVRQSLDGEIADLERALR